MAIDNMSNKSDAFMFLQKQIVDDMYSTLKEIIGLDSDNYTPEVLAVVCAGKFAVLDVKLRKLYYTQKDMDDLTSINTRNIN